jgi:serine/threonine-protein kinase
VLSELGEGAFARVYRAREKTTGRETALKILKEGFAGDAEVVERFRREVFAVASIDSPHVVKLHDFGMTGADVFIAMEYVQGPTLRELLRGRPWSAEAVRVVVGQIAQALSAAHAQGIVHRDLKPENVILVRGEHGRQVKVLDFGLAKLVAIERKLALEPLTQAGMCFGTPQYMAPEQMQGRPASQSADLFALAVIAYEMLSGRLPWDGSDPREVFRAVLGTPPPPLERLHPTVEAQRGTLDRFFIEALAKTPEKRQPDATAFFGAFEVALFGRVRHTGPVFSTVISVELQTPDVEPDDPTGTDPPLQPLPDTLEDAGFDALQSTTAPGKLGGVPTGRRLHSMFSMSLSTLPPLSPGDDDDAPLLAAPPVVRKSGSTRAPAPSDMAAVTDGEAPDAKKKRESVTDLVPRTGGAPTRWLVLAAFCLIVVAALAGYFVGRGPR